jgi:hypothetical protein
VLASKPPFSAPTVEVCRLGGTNDQIQVVDDPDRSRGGCSHFDRHACVGRPARRGMAKCRRRGWCRRRFRCRSCGIEFVLLLRVRLWQVPRAVWRRCVLLTAPNVPSNLNQKGKMIMKTTLAILVLGSLALMTSGAIAYQSRANGNQSYPNYDRQDYQNRSCCSWKTTHKAPHKPIKH